MAILFSVSLQPQAQITELKQQRLDNLLKHDCGSCHGINRSGGLGPSLLVDDMEKYSLESLTAVILNGLPGTAMPPWSDLISAEDARYLANRLKSTQDKQ